jgi:hypothetical protein
MRSIAVFIALAPLFTKGIAVTVTAVVLFIGSVYLLLAAIFGLRMGYLVLAVSFFGWMLILSALWAFGVPGTLPDLGPRGTEPHWEVFAAGTGTVESQYPQTAKYPGPPWSPPNETSEASVDSVRTAVQNYLAQRASEQLRERGEDVALDFTDFAVEDFAFTNAADGEDHLGAGRGFYTAGGPAVTVFVVYDKGNVDIYSWSFLAASALGFAIHLPFLDRAERRRRAILTGGTAPPWYGPA